MENEKKLREKEIKENTKSDQEVFKKGDVNVSKKYKLSGPILSQKEIDEIVKKRKKKQSNL